MNLLKTLNRKQRRQFNKLDKQEQIKIVAQQINEKTSKTTQEHIAKAFVDGTLTAYKLLGDRYLERYESAQTENDFKELMDDLFKEVKRKIDIYNERFKESEDKA